MFELKFKHGSFEEMENESNLNLKNKLESQIRIIRFLVCRIPFSNLISVKKKNLEYEFHTKFPKYVLHISIGP